jgi:hypothetical protein
VNAFLKYNLMRLGLLVVAVGLCWFLPLNLLVRLMLAVVLSGVASFFLLRGVRDEMAANIAAGVEKRRAEREKLRSALAGDDEAPPAA